MNKLYGGSRSGKTFLLTHAVFLKAMKYPNTRHAMVRQHQTDARQSFTFDNGSMIEIMGVDEANSNIGGQKDNPVVVATEEKDL